jgi:two-component system nitrogen regulation response regulator GlnG
LGIFDDIIRVVEKILIKSALERVDHVQITAAQLLGINRNTLRKKIKELKIRPR